MRDTLILQSCVRAHDDLVVALGMGVVETMARGTGIELPAFTCGAGAMIAPTCFLLNPSGGHVVPNGTRFGQQGSQVHEFVVDE